MRCRDFRAVAQGSAASMNRRTSEKAAPVLVYLVTEDWYFLSHRLPMARAARDARLRGPCRDPSEWRRAREIEAQGFHLHALDWRRGSFNPLDLVSIVRQVRALYRQLQPDLVHHVALQPSIVGSLAARGMPFPRLNALAGLGFGFTSATVKGQARAAGSLGVAAVSVQNVRKPRCSFKIPMIARRWRRSVSRRSGFSPCPDRASTPNA